MEFLKNLFGDRSLGERFGEGSFGAVYRGTYRGSQVAIKKIQIDHLQAERIDREHKAMRQLDHRNVLKLLYWEDKNEFRY
jgi:serine/threonine protein kinase